MTSVLSFSFHGDGETSVEKTQEHFGSRHACFVILPLLATRFPPQTCFLSLNGDKDAWLPDWYEA